MFPNDAITLRYANNTGTDNVSYNFLPTGTYTILSIISNSKDARDSVIKCGTDIMYQQRSTLFVEQNMNYLCVNKSVTSLIDRTTTISITYVPYNLRIVPTNTGNFTLDNGATFTAGDMFTGFLLLIGLFIAIITLALKSIFGVKTHREFLGVNSIEGKENFKI